MAITEFDVTPEQRASFGAFLKRRFFGEPKALTRSDVDLTGKTAIITGSNTGIGLECGRQLLDLGLSKLVIAVRSESKGEAARVSLAAKRAGDYTVEVWKLDMSSYESMSSFVERAKGLDRLDICILNAGISKIEFDLVKDTGHEEMVQVNYLSTAYLCLKMLLVLKDKNPPDQPGHLAMVSSDTSAWTPFPEQKSRPLLPGFDHPESFGQSRYATSKLLGQLFLTELAKRVPSSAAIVNAPNPGWCHGSGLYRDVHGSVTAVIFKFFMSFLSWPAATGARVLVDAAVKKGSESHGCYIESGKVQPMAPFVYKPEGQEVAKVLWEETMKEFETIKPELIIKQLNQ